MSELDKDDKLLLRKAYEKMNAANEVLRFLADHFRDKYELTPNNQITPDGQIIDATPQTFDGADSKENVLDMPQL